MEQNTCSNTHECNCKTTDCARHGRCCDCVAYHKNRGNLPNCLRTEKKS